MATDEADSLLRGVARAPALRPPPRIGELIGERYVIEAFLGEGGMGSVYRALDEKLGEHVALKVVNGALDDSILRQEVRLAQKVTHPNVCRTFDLEDIDGRQIVKMELIAGETLAKRLAAGQLSVAEAVRIARAIAAGLAAAHAKNIIHGDLKPGNVMLHDDRVVLMDFGTAYFAASPDGRLHGTVGYIAPEKLRDQSGDARSDDYALGCVLYEMLAGEALFAGSAATIAALHIRQEAPDVRKKRKDVPRWLARVVAKLLAKEPADRAHGLRRLVTGSRSRTWIGVALVAIITSVAFALWWQTAIHRWSPVTWKPVQDIDENLARIDISPDNRWLVFESDRAPDDKAANVSRIYVMSLASRTATALDLPGHDFGSPRFSNAGTEVTYEEDGSTWSQPITGSPPHATGQPRLLFRGAHASSCGDGYVFRRVHNNGAWQLWSIDAHGNEALLYAGEGEAIGAPTCDRAGELVVFARGTVSGNDAYMINRATRSLTKITNGHRLTGDVAFSQDEKSLIVGMAASNETTQLFELPLDGGSPQQITSGELSSTEPSLSRDGTHLVYTHDGTWFPPVIIGSSVKKLTSDKSEYFHNRPFDRNHIVTERAKGHHSEIELLSISTGKVTPLAEGRDPFVSFDHRSIYFSNIEDPHFLERVVVATKATSVVAWLPGELYSGEDGPEGIHIAVSIGDQTRGYQIAYGHVAYEHVDGLVTVAPTGGWRAVTSYLATTNRISLVPPNASLDHPVRTFDVQSIYNRWLDDHTLAYCTARCVELDVLTGVETTVGDGNFLATETDDHQLIDFGFEPGQASMRVITNFGDR